MTGDGTEDEEYAEVLRQISQDAWERNRQRADELVELVTAAPDGADELSADARQRALSLAHQLHGSAGTFGYPMAADAAERIERLLRAHAAITSADRSRLAEFAEALRTALEGRPSGEG